uniref:Uncharacterized protein n=1 Tax=Anguilla anguilla TaxID=7936 RepID=A0A0E9R6C3_ANGAN
MRVHSGNQDTMKSKATMSNILITLFFFLDTV